MPLLRDDDLVRIDLPADGEWVEVKRRLSRGDEVVMRQAAGRGARVVAGSAGAILDAANAIEAVEFAALDLAIKRWSFPEPVTPENIRTLDGESIDAIKDRLEVLYAPRTDDEVKNSAGDTPTPFLGRDQSPASLAG